MERRVTRCASSPRLSSGYCVGSPNALFIKSPSISIRKDGRENRRDSVSTISLTSIPKVDEDATPRIFNYPWAQGSLPLRKHEDIGKEVHRIMRLYGVFAEHPKAEAIFKGLEPSKLGPYMFPNADRERLILVTLFLTTFFVYDDFIEDSPEGETEPDKLVELITGEIHVSAGERRSLLHVIGFLGQSFRKVMSPTWMERFRTGMDVYIKSLGHEHNLLDKAQVHGHPRVSDFMDWRSPNIGGHVVCYLVEFIYGSALPTDWAWSELVIKIQNLWNMLMMFQNDYISWMAGRDKGKLNIVFSFSQEFFMTEGTSGQMAMNMHDAVVKDLTALCAELDSRSRGELQVRKWIDGCKNAFIGFARYQEEAARYRKMKVAALAAQVAEKIVL